MRARGILAALFIAFAFVGHANAAERTVVVVMFDGFAPAMADATATPNLDRIKREGVWSRHLVPEFPSLSMTNHTTFETGCTPAHHGIMSNIFYDPKKGRYREDPDADWMQGCETMWEAAEKQGVKSAVFNFVNRWSTKRGELATYTNPPVPWAQHESDETIMNRALSLLRDKRPDHPRLIALYFPIPDEIAHYNGTTAPKTLAAVRKCDAIVGRLMAAIKALPPDREGTLVIGTDHGMMDIGPLINIGRIMNANDIHAKQASDGATAFLYLDKGESIDRVQNALKQYAYAFDVYRRGHYPAFAHLGDNPRTGDLMIVAHPPYWIAGPEVFPAYASWLGVTHIWPSTFTPPFGGLKATHGFDPHIVQMHGIFYAWGAGIAKGKEIPRLDMVDVHPTVMALLGLQPGQPQDGHAVDAALIH
ncbi:MAG TPA: ectonucleotide pyrophosphatase/phosphodiesterase [Rhizomicrobium sp.]